MIRNNRNSSWMVCALCAALCVAAAHADGVSTGRCCFWSGQDFECLDSASEALCGYLGGDWAVNESCASNPCELLTGRVCEIDENPDKTYSTFCYEMTYADHLDNIENKVYTLEQANWTWPGDCSGTPECPIGHCCYIEITKPKCAITVEETCDDLGGSWDAGAVHGATDCDSHGRCCDNADSGYCEVLPEVKCVGEGLVWIWGADCDPVLSDCNFGHCCFLDVNFYAKCDLTLEALCDDFGGFWDEGLKCADVDCTSHGRCCIFDAAGGVLECKIEEWSKCEIENDRGFWTWLEDCSGTTPCVAQGACCFIDDVEVVCEQVSEDICQYLEGEWQPLTRCWEGECPTLGRCCVSDGSELACSNRFDSQCDAMGGIWTAENTCEGPTCPPFGACCYEFAGDSHCIFVTNAECVWRQGSWSEGSECEVAECDLGACCIIENGDPRCVVAYRRDCRQSEGVWAGDESCATVSCSDVGRCCYMDDGAPACVNAFEEVCVHEFAGAWDPVNSCAAPQDCYGLAKITLFSNMGKSGSSGYDHGQGNEPVVVGLSPLTGDNIAAMAVPFVPEYSGTISDIYVPIVFLNDVDAVPGGVEWADASDDYLLAVLPDVDGKPCALGEGATIGYNCNANSNPAGIPFVRVPYIGVGRDDPFDVCDCDAACVCFGREAITNSYRVSLESNPSDYWPTVYAGEQYWLVMYKYNAAVPHTPGHDALVWYRTTEVAAQGSGMCLMEREASDNGNGGTQYSLKRWESLPDTTFAALRIDGVPREDCFHESSNYLEPSPYEPPIEFGGECETTEFESTCWFNRYARGDRAPESGFPLNVDLASALSPPDFPPLSTDPIENTLPFVSKEVRHFGAPSRFHERSAHRDIIDNATGAPLIQATDFELPFGGAMFRHTRTYSENLGDSFRPYVRSAGGNGEQTAPSSTHWDWNGMFWMMSENPILLIDVAYQTETDAINLMGSDEKRCYLIPDAHHSIPFRFNGTDYEAPDWFDAVIQPSDELVDVPFEGNGVALPKEYYVWLNRRSVKYTFAAQYQDLWKVRDPQTNEWKSVHQPRAAQGAGGPGGMGLPYYGLITSIEDRYGNRVEYEYCGQKRFACPEQYESGCQHCCQNCNEKGQIKSIKLISPDSSGNDQVVWTLLYTHRGFKEGCGILAESCPDWLIYDPDDHPYPEILNDHVLHSIHVFEGPIEPITDDCLTIPGAAFCGASTLEEIDAIPNHAAIPDSWVIEVKYLYSEGGDIIYQENGEPYPTGLTGCNALGEFTSSTARIERASIEIGNALVPRWYMTPGRLQKVVTTRRSKELQDDISDQRVTLFKDATRAYSFTGGANLPSSDAICYLGWIYDHETIQSIISADEEITSANDVLRAEHVHQVGFTTTNDLNQKVVTPAALGDVADVQIDETRNCGADNPVLAALAMDAGLELGRTAAHCGGATGLIDRRSEFMEIGEFKYYRFVVLPERDGGYSVNPVTGLMSAEPSIYYHFPTLYEEPDAGLNYALTSQSNGNEPFFVAIIDEIDREANGAYDPIAAKGIRSRRIVYLNSQGLSIKDKTTNYENGESVGSSQVGFAESVKYDDQGRIIERRSTGWDTLPTEQERETKGLIHVYLYDDTVGPNNPNPGELIAEGVKQGTAGTPYWLKRFYRDIEGRPELITREVRFTEPTTDPNTPGQEESIVYYEFGTVDSDGVPIDDVENRPLKNKTTIGAATPLEPGGTPYYAYYSERYTDNGNTEWVGVGNSTANTGDPVAPTAFYLTKTTYDEAKGWPIMVVSDTIDSPPVGWPTRVDPQLSQPLNLVTEHFYDPVYGLVRTIFPNNRETVIAYVADSENPGGLYKWEFKDLVYRNDNFVPLSPVVIYKLHGGRVIEKTVVRLKPEHTDATPDGAGAETAFAEEEIISITTPEYDANGQAVGITNEGGDGATISSRVLYNAFGEVSREIGPDGTITRKVYDSRGRLLRVYSGTNDEHAFWGTGIACETWEDPATDNCTDPDEFPDNMFLLEKYYYGESETNADLPVAVRTYTESPLNPYFERVPDGTPPEETPPQNNENRIGYTSQMGYDWRMRQVMSVENSSTVDDPGAEGCNASVPQFGPPINHSLVWFDEHDRTRFTAEYGDQMPTGDDSVNPLGFAPGDTVTANEILSDPVPPISLTETIYNARGQIEETRMYDVSSDPLTPQYTNTRTYIGYHGRPVEVHSSGGVVTKYIYDSKVRQTRSSTYAAGIEVARNETVYDNDDRAIATVSWQRMPAIPESETELTESNSVRTFSYTWYDIEGKVIATVAFGTNSAGDNYDNADSLSLPAPPDSNNPNSAPVVFDAVDPDKVIGIDITGYPAHARITAYGYDEANRQSAVFHPDGTATRTEYDDLGRILVQAENADAADARQVRRYAYRYDDKGRVELMAAIVSGYTTYESIDWSATNGSVQVTKIVYGAEVHNPAGNNSANNGWIKEVFFPGDNGQPETAGGKRISLTYYPQGMVRSRTDSREVVFTHYYDDLKRRIETTIDDSAVYLEGGPADRAKRITYLYYEDSLLDTVTLYTENDVVIAENKYVYDDRDNLLHEYQAHGGHVVVGVSPRIDYGWAFSSASEGNYDRLTSMTYPDPLGSLAPRELAFNYGSGLDDALSRITSIHDSVENVNVAAYTYYGTGSRASILTGNGVRQSYADANGKLTRLDRYGRMKDLHFTDDATGFTIHRYQYSHDIMGNRTSARATQGPDADDDDEPDHDNDRSWEYSYDGLNRLIQAELGQLNAGQVTAPPPPGLMHQKVWELDALGNWAGDSAGQASVTITGDFDGDGNVDPTPQTLHHDVTGNNELANLLVDGVAQAYQHDAAGNMTADGAYVYLYDGLNRLIEIRPSGASNDYVAGLTYDAFGRLIRIDRRITPTVEAAAIVDLYYDGIRRVQEVGKIVGIPGAGVTIESAWSAEHIEREYVYGPDEVDEFILQSDGAGTAVYVVQDGNYSVVGLTNEIGEILEQYTFSPYGKTLVTERFGADPHNQLGHQGLFYLRFDRCAYGVTGNETLAPGSAGLYYNRNRWYSPLLGRFTQPDPKATELPILNIAAMNGDALEALTGTLNVEERYSDGFNLYQYEQSNPIANRDPLGTDDFDNLVSDLQGHKVTTIGYIQSASGWALVGLNMAADVAGGLLGFDLVKAATNVYDGKGTFWDWLEIGMSVGGAAVVAFKAFRMARKFAARGKLAKYGDMAKRFCKISCFVSGTLVATPQGMTAIELLRVGDVVLTRNENCGDGVTTGVVTTIFRSVMPETLWLEFSDGTVLGTTPPHEFHTSEGAWIPAEYLVVGDSITGRLEPGQNARLVGEPLTIAGIHTERTPTVVYNLEVGGSHTYFAEGVWVHNCGERIARLVGHHTVPSQVLDYLDPKVLSRLRHQRGGNRLIWDIPEDLHKVLHGGLGKGFKGNGTLGKGGGGWNARWRAELQASAKKVKDLTLDDVISIRDRIVRDFDLDAFRPVGPRPR